MEQIEIPVLEDSSLEPISLIKAQMSLAKKYPRDKNKVLAEIANVFADPLIAKDSWYSIPAYGKSSGNVVGETIKMATMLIPLIGNIRWGIIERERQEGFSKMTVFCHDLETNSYFEQKFISAHKNQGNKPEEQERQKAYGLNSEASKRLRQCVFKAISPEYVQQAIKVSKAAMQSDYSKDPSKLRNDLVMFARLWLGITNIETLLRCTDKKSLNDITFDDYSRLMGIINTCHHEKRNISDFYLKPSELAASSIANPPEMEIPQ